MPRPATPPSPPAATAHSPSPRPTAAPPPSPSTRPSGPCTSPTATTPSPSSPPPDEASADCPPAGGQSAQSRKWRDAPSGPLMAHIMTVGTAHERTICAGWLAWTTQKPRAPIRRDQRGVAVGHALTACDEQGPGLVAADLLRV